MALANQIILRGTRAAQPAAASLTAGAIYGVTDEGNKLERTTGAAWEAYSPTGSGDVTGQAASIDSEIALFSSTTGKVIKRATGTGFVKVTAGVIGTPSATVALATEVSGTLPTTNLTTPVKTRVITVTMSGGGSAITTGIKCDASIPYTCTITGVRMAADQSGSIVVDIWKDTYANYPPTVADTITAAAKPTISAATKSEDTTLTGWTTAVTAGDMLRFNVDSAATVTRLVLTLTVTV